MDLGSGHQSLGIVDAQALNFLPSQLVQALEDYALSIGSTEIRVIEMALASFLKLGAIEYSEIDELPTYGEMKARLEVLEIIWQAAKEGKLTQQVIDNIASLGY